MSEQAAILVPPDSTVRVGDFEFDLVIGGAATHVVSCTSYPRENGASAQDHATKEPITETVQALLTDTPLGESVAIPGRAREMLEELVSLQEALVPVTFSSTVSDLGEVIIREVRPRVSKAGGYSITVDITVESVHRVEQQMVQIPPQHVSAGVAHSTQPEGEATPRNAREPRSEDEGRRGSLLYNLFF